MSLFSNEQGQSFYGAIMIKIYQDKKKDKLTIGIHFGNFCIGVYYNKLIRTLFLYPIPFLVIRIRL